MPPVNWEEQTNLSKFDVCADIGLMWPVLPSFFHAYTSSKARFTKMKQSQKFWKGLQAFSREGGLFDIQRIKTVVKSINFLLLLNPIVLPILHHLQPLCSFSVCRLCCVLLPQNLPSVKNYSFEQEHDFEWPFPVWRGIMDFIGLNCKCLCGIQNKLKWTKSRICFLSKMQPPNIKIKPGGIKGVLNNSLFICVLITKPNEWMPLTAKVASNKTQLCAEISHYEEEICSRIKFVK